MKRLICLIAFALPVWGASCPSGYGYYKTLTVQTGKVSGTQTNFPTLILNPASTSGTLRTTGNGGHVTSASGYDIVPATTAGALLPFELVSGSYTASNGNLQMWVKVSSIADSTAINLCYGNSGVTTYQGNNAATWAGYAMVAHLDDNAGTTVVADSLAADNGASASNTSTKTVAGKLGSGLTFNGTSDYVNFSNPANLQFPGTSTYSYSTWVNFAALPTGEHDLIKWFGPSSGIADGLNVLSNDSKNAMYRNGAANVLGTTVYATGNWYYSVVTYDGTSGRIYDNGAKRTTTASGTLSGALTGARTVLGAGWNGSVYGQFSNAVFDEVHITSAVLSDAWILTEYNNQNAPGNDGAAGFWGVGGEVGLGVPTMAITPTAIPNGHAGNITLTLTGTGTSWSGSSVMTAAGVANVSCGAVAVTSATAATVICTTGAGTGTLTITESVMGTAVSSTTVSVPSFSVNYIRGNLNSVQTLTLTGSNTVWSQETAAGLFTFYGGTGASIGTPTITTNAAGTVALTVGTAAGPLTITDASTGKTATFTAGSVAGPSGCAVVYTQ
jgi:hypothetical protein